MSIEVDWERLTGGREGDALAESIKTFIHDRFQQVKLPRFIRSVKVHSFHFGTIAPQVEVKDVCEPLPDFYENDDDDDDHIEEADQKQEVERNEESSQPTETTNNFVLNSSQSQSQQHYDNAASKSSRPHLNAVVPSAEQIGQMLNSSTSVPSVQGPKAGIPGGTSNMSYFHLPLSAGLSGSSTPLGAGPRFGGSLLDHLHNSNSSSSHLKKPISPPPPATIQNDTVPDAKGSPSPDHNASDLQIVAHLRYDGDVRLSLTAEVMLDYPMESFVGIPLQLNVTGLTFDGVAILAYIKHKAHFCFLAPEDADALVGGEDANELGSDVHASVDDGSHGQEGQGNERMKPGTEGKRKPIGSLFEEIRVESEIGEREKGKQVLKNIGKVEKFVLDQVRRIFENELVYPSFWTFLV